MHQVITCSTGNHDLCHIHIATAWSKGGTHQFILHWHDQIHHLDELSGTKCHFLDFMKMIVLQHAVHLNLDFHQIKETAALQKVQGVKDLDFNAYFKLVEAAEISYDAQFNT